MERLLIRRATGIIMVNDSLADLLARYHKLTSLPVVLRNSVPYWEPTAGMSRGMRGWLGLNPEQKVLLFTGGITPTRELETCLGVLPHIPEACLVGLGPVDQVYRAHLIRRASGLGVSERFYLPGVVAYEE